MRVGNGRPPTGKKEVTNVCQPAFPTVFLFRMGDSPIPTSKIVLGSGAGQSFRDPESEWLLQLYARGISLALPGLALEIITH